MLHHVSCLAGAGAFSLLLKEYIERHIDPPKAFDPRTMRAVAALGAIWAAWICWACRGRALGGVACFVWVTTWLVTPFLATLVLALELGWMAPVALWLGLGFLAPTLPQSNAFRRVMRSMSSWFDEHTIVGSFAQPPGSKPVFYCHHPHGQVAIMAVASGSEVDCGGVTAPAVFRMPFCRQMMELMGSVSSSPGPFKAVLRSGRNVAIIPGGVEEVVLSSAAAERAYVLQRKGFVKYAIQHGYDLIPIYHFGETQMFTLLWPSDVPWVVRLKLAVAQRLQLATGIGGGFPHLPLLPNPCRRCRTVVGERIALPHDEGIDREGVQRWHAEYVARLQALYNEHRHALPEYKDKELELW